MPPFKDYAQKLYEKGYSVIPVEGKRPLIKDWSKYCKELPTQEEIDKWEENFQNSNIGLCLGQASGIIALDIDTDDEELSKMILEKVPPSPLKKKGKRGFTLIYKYSGQLAEKLKRNGVIFVEILSTGNQTVIPPSIHPDTKQAYVWSGESLLSIDKEDLPDLTADCIEKLRKLANGNSSTNTTNSTSGRNEKLKSITTAMHYSGESIDAIVKRVMEYDSANHSPALFTDKNEAICKADHYTNASNFVVSVVRSINKGEISKGNISFSPIFTLEPEISLDSPAFDNLLGRIIKKLIPHTEGSAVAILSQLMGFIGTLIGKKPYCYADANKLYANLFFAIVGASSKARKGTSLAVVKLIVDKIDPDFLSKNVANGISSGEGIIYHVRDNVTETTEGKKTKEHTGIEDKRKVIIETELSNLFRVANRETNITSQVMRDIWDCIKVLQTLAKNAFCKSTDAFISLIGHITIHELRQDFKTKEIYNGFGNRIIWIYSKRSKRLSRGNKLHTVDISQEVEELKTNIERAKRFGEIQFTQEAGILWDQYYEEFAVETDGDIGALKSRDEAQTLKLALCFALIDGSEFINVHHLRSAKALWDYSSQSIDYIWSNSNTAIDRNTSKVIQYLRTNAKASRSEISRNLFNKNLSARELDRIKNELSQYGGKVFTDSGTEYWQLE